MEKQLPAVIYPVANIYEFNVDLRPTYNEEDVAMNVCAPLLLLAAFQDDEYVKEKMDEHGIDQDSVNEAAIDALAMFRSFMGFDD